MNESKGGVLDWLSRRLNLTEIFSLLTSYGLFYAELDARKPIREALSEALARPLPSYARWPRVLGLVVVVLIAIEIFTGGLLALYYLPTAETAHASHGTIVRDVQFGWFVHQIHFWGAQILLAILAVRLLRFLVGRVYRAPRELVWVFSVLLLLVCLQLDLTGRILPFTAAAYWSGIRALEVVASIPVLGSILVYLLGGDATFISDLTLIRVYILHAAVLPVLAVVLVYLHFSTVRRVGLSEREGEAEARGGGALRRHLVNLAILLTLLAGLLVTLAVLAPEPFQAEADPFSTVPGIGPPWYLLAPFGLLEWTAGALPRGLVGGLLLALLAAVLAVPAFDREGSPPWRRRVLLVLGLLLVLGWLALTLFGARVA